MNGILIVDKPQDWTSHDVVAKLRGIYRERRIGHSGTLDPMATGVLTVFLGRATRAVELCENDEKTYVAGLRLGTVTNTQDITGEILESRSVDITELQLQQVLTQFLGPQQQIPPMYSAVKIQGKKLYELARKGQTVERKPRNIVIHELKLLGRQQEDFLLEIRCSKGTYVRTLCHDIGEKLGCGGCLSSLRRTEAGRFSLEDAVTLEDILKAQAEGRQQELLRSVDSLFDRLPSLTLRGEAERRMRNGGTILLKNQPDGEYRVYGQSGEFLLLGRVEAEMLTTVKSFFEVKSV